MVSVGLIHMSCYCGADLFYIGNTVDGAPPIDILERFEAQLGSGNFGFFSSANGDFGECPHCGLLFDLPDPGMLDWLPFTDTRTFTEKVAELRQSVLSADRDGTQRTYTAIDRRSY